MSELPYKILRSHDLDDLERQVNDHVRRGYIVGDSWKMGGYSNGSGFVPEMIAQAVYIDGNRHYCLDCPLPAQKMNPK